MKDISTRGIKLKTINDLLRKIGFLLVIAIPDSDEDPPTRLWIQRAKTYKGGTY